MANFQYKVGAGSWTDVPATAHHGVWDGTAELVVPEAAARDGRGKPCAAVGKPWLQIRSQRMTATGIDFWQDFFVDSDNTSSSDVKSASLHITAKNPLNNTWQGWSGSLVRPRWRRVQQGSGSANTNYFDVELEVVELVASTWP